MRVIDGEITNVDYISGTGVVKATNGLSYQFMLYHFVSGWPVHVLNIGDAVRVRMSDDMTEVLSVRRG